MKYGILLLQDSVYSYPKDQIKLEDRILNNYNNMKSVRLSAIRGKDTNDLLQKVRSSHEKLYYWNKSLGDVPKYVYVMIGLDELKGGASHKWNNRHLESLILELLVYDFEVVLFTSHIHKEIAENQKAWSQQFKNRVRRLSKKYNLDCIINTQNSIDLNRDEIIKIAQRISKHTKGLYAQQVTNFNYTTTKRTTNKPKVEVIEIKPRQKKIKHASGVVRPQRKIKKIIPKEVDTTINKIEIPISSKEESKKKGRKINKIGTTLIIDTDKKNLASY